MVRRKAKDFGRGLQNLMGNQEITRHQKFPNFEQLITHCGTGNEKAGTGLPSPGRSTCSPGAQMKKVPRPGWIINSD
ncbi:hypothetical protein RvY_18457 [Ramazzottius varieornatus]|uniref:Uncharacterized protein n=1 Tax=Ramazzottius varieornatus TaxID=947166 RepID=A0A1D1W5W0_RAMVA|nr:hypothetical protein RvY_18457 [Ramazzottius varieornatus]